MVSQLQFTPKAPKVSEAQTFELPKHDKGVAEIKPVITPSSVIVKESTSPLAEVKNTLTQVSAKMQSVFMDKDENLKLQTECKNLHNIKTDLNDQEINLATDLTLSPEKTEVAQG